AEFLFWLSQRGKFWPYTLKYQETSYMSPAATS
ncbi:MAG: hypothetical protein ACI9W0_000462, partial [Gammaproteobacteria bacterium]